MQCRKWRDATSGRDNRGSAARALRKSQVEDDSPESELTSFISPSKLSWKTCSSVAWSRFIGPHGDHFHHRRARLAHCNRLQCGSYWRLLLPRPKGCMLLAPLDNSQYGTRPGCRAPGRGPNSPRFRNGSRLVPFMPKPRRPLRMTSSGSTGWRRLFSKELSVRMA